MSARLLIVDDEQDMLRMLTRAIRADIDCQITTAASGPEALERLARERFDLALVDIRMAPMDGLTLLEKIHEHDPWLTVVMMTAYGVIEVAVESIRRGAYDFITKPFETSELNRLIAKALERSRLVQENLRLQQQARREEGFHGLIGGAAAMQRLFDTLQLIGPTDVTVLITGESGTGKNLVARALHDLSPRRAKPFVRVNCPTVPESILESELFGYRKGAFTHASQDRQGVFEAAQGGTLCLDEIGDIPMSIQTKLLEVLEEKVIKPLGQAQPVTVDVRLIACTNQDLRRKIEARTFREDLFYRLNVVNLSLPPLRSRREDIPVLVQHFLERTCAEFGRPAKRISPSLMQRLLEHPWEGNVRELANTIKRAVVLAHDEWIQPADTGLGPASEAQCPEFLPGGPLPPYREAKLRMLRHFHQEYLGRALRRTDGNVTRAAQQIGLERQSLQQIMKKYGILPQEFK
jgi:DNA-binding NtrC family response regulator